MSLEYSTAKTVTETASRDVKKVHANRVIIDSPLEFDTDGNLVPFNVRVRFTEVDGDGGVRDGKDVSLTQDEVAAALGGDFAATLTSLKNCIYTIAAEKIYPPNGVIS